jgi:hypothetical protein
MAFVEVLGRSGGPPPYPDITTIPTPPLQQAAVAIIFIFPALSIILFSMRAYIRIAMRQWGWDDFLCGLALVCLHGYVFADIVANQCSCSLC